MGWKNTRFSRCSSLLWPSNGMFRVYKGDATVHKRHGIRVLVYIDDELGFAHSYEGAQRVAAIVKSDLENAGWVLNVQKTRLSPR